MKAFKPKTRVKLIFLAVLALTVLALPATAFAHPLGNFTVNQYSRIEVGAAGVNVYFVLDMAEIPTFQEKDLIDQNKDGQLSQDEQTQYGDAKTKQLLSNLKLAINGAPVEMKTVSNNISFIAGQGGLQTLRLTAHFQTAALSSDATSLSYSDSNYADRIGWREIVLRNATGVAVTGASVPDKDQTNELRVYPEDMLASPLQVTSAQASFKLDPSVVVNRNDYPQDAEIVKTQDPLANLINGELTLPVILFALLASVVLGMFHALSPGHGKTVVAAYLVGSRGTAKHAVFLGLTVTITHTIGVFVLGLITLFASQYILPEKLYPWLGLLSGLLVVGMGLSLFRSRLLSARGKGNNTVLEAAHGHADHSHSHAGHTHSHDHDHEHTHSHGSHSHTHQAHSHDMHDHSHDHDHIHSQEGHIHDHDHEHDHTHSHEETENMAAKQPALALTATGSAASTVPVENRAATLLPPLETAHTHGIGEHSHHDHGHEHSHSHSHDDHSHGHHEHDHDHLHAHTHDDHGHAHSHDGHDHSHDNGLVHSHGGKMHSHLPPGTDGKTVTWKNLLLFGISAGLLPCPSALVLMLSAIALNRTALGLVMIVFFSAGLAGTLTLVGLLLVYARNRFNRLKMGRANTLVRLLPIVSAALVAILGFAITYEGLIQTGLLK
ncbi:MAG: sulfite exporter TauE/SafE family protein [Chloroflexi bacterium]|nr:sulfite exporter TauE/SafE family protein [Chloroflexota bacterium]OJW02803.1 MAG: hypothetical protein BGO39_06150 [Chloroflexi bacterium 54-19]